MWSRTSIALRPPVFWFATRLYESSCANGEGNPDLTWKRFRVGRREIESALTERGIKIIDATDFDAALVQRVEERLLALSENPAIRGRTVMAAKADAMTCGAVVRWRQQTPTDPPIAWFVANERLTQQAFAELVEDPYPLVASPEAWLMYISRLGESDPQALRSLADTLADATRRASFLSVASSFTVEDVLRFAKMLEEYPGRGVSPDDLRQTVQLDFVEFIEESGGGDVHDIRAYADRALRDRTRRRDESSRRVKERADLAQRHVEERVARAVQAARAEERAASKAREAILEDRVRRVENRADAADRAHTKQVRRIVWVFVLAVLIAANVVALPGTALAFKVLSIAGSVAVMSLLAKFIHDERPLRWLVLELLIGAAFVSVELAAGELLF